MLDYCVVSNVNNHVLKYRTTLCKINDTQHTKLPLLCQKQTLRRNNSCKFAHTKLTKILGQRSALNETPAYYVAWLQTWDPCVSKPNQANTCWWGVSCFGQAVLSTGEYPVQMNWIRSWNNDPRLIVHQACPSTAFFVLL